MAQAGFVIRGTRFQILRARLFKGDAMTQMIAHYTTTDYARFKAAFDADAEDRGNNSLSLLQLWREDNGNVWALFQVGDAKAARAYLDGAAGVFNSQAGVQGVDYHFVETA